MAFKKLFTTNTPNKLKHMALYQIYDELINTSLIFTYNTHNNCCFDQFQGCRVKALTSWWDSQINYCFVCCVKVTYNIDKIYKLKRIDEIINTFLQIKEDLQLCINFGCANFWLYWFQIKKKKFSKTYSQYLKKFTIDGYRSICTRDLWN